MTSRLLRPVLARQTSRALRALPAWVLVLGLTACASPTTRFHTLMPSPDGAASTAPAARTVVEFAPVVLPAQIDRPQWVLRRDDDSLQLLEHERWIAPLNDELQGALAHQLQRMPGLPAPPAQADARPWRLLLEVRRWDARLGGYSRLDAQWQVAVGANVLRTCGVTLRQPAPGGLDALAAAHRLVVAQLGEAMARSLSGC